MGGIGLGEPVESALFVAIRSNRRMLLAVVVCFLMTSTTAFALVSTNDVGDNPEDARLASTGNRELRIGWVGLQSSVATLNPLLYTMSGEMTMIFPCYSYLTQFDSDGKTRIGDLAESWSLDPDGCTWHFYLYKTAKFYNRLAPYENRPVTADDVIFTYYLVQNQTGNSLQSSLSTVDVGGVQVPVIQSMYKVNDYELVLKTVIPYAPLLSATSTIPILPKYIWQFRTWNWQNHDSGDLVAPAVGSGPFYFMEDGVTTAGFYRLARSPTWFGTEEQGWQVKCSKIIYRSELSPSVALMDFQNGVIDLMLGCTPDQFMHSIPAIPGAVRQASSSGFVYELNINQITSEIRDTYGIAPQLGNKDNPILLDPVFKMAMAMCVNKQGFVNDVLQGLGGPADSLIPDVSPWHYWYGLQPGEDSLRPGRAPVGEEPVAYDPVGARMLLYAWGWKYRTTGMELLPSDFDYLTYAPLCRIGGTQPLQFRFYTLNTDPIWNTGAMYIAQSAGVAGIDLMTFYQSMSIPEMNLAWAKANYDLWLWDWMFLPSSDPSTDIMHTLTTYSIPTYSDVFWSNETYDSVYDQSVTAIDPVERQALIDELQRLAYEDKGCQLVAYACSLSAMRTCSPDFWGNWGNWSDQWILEPSQLSPWLYTRIEPQENPAPVFTSVPPQYTGNVGTPLEMTATATDSDPLEYRWVFGDGNKSGWSTSPTVSHIYASAANFSATIVAREIGTLDGFMTSATVSVAITGEMIPYDLSLTKGWNLVSIPLVNHSYTASTLPLRMFDTVVRWNTITQNYSQSYVFGVSPPSVDFPIESSTSYWIFAGASETLRLYGDTPTATQTRNITVPGTMGWAFIGFATPNATWHASDVFRMYSGTISSIYAFDNVAKVWKMYIPGIPPADFLLIPGRGYLIWCTSGILTYNPSSIWMTPP